MLRFSEANAKTKQLLELPELQNYLQGGRKVYSLDLLSGWTCPAARDCFARAIVDNHGNRFLLDGPHTRFRCFSASQEVAFPAVYNMRNENFQAIRKMRGHKQIAQLICALLPKDAGVIRYHVAGDFFKFEYLRGAVLAAKMRPDVLFYAYTKMINHLSGIKMDNPAKGVIKPNFLITASLGGRYDRMIRTLRLRTAKVVFSEAEADNFGLPIDHDDSHAATIGGSFALLLHGIQPKGSEAAEALKILKGKVHYNRKVKR